MKTIGIIGGGQLGLMIAEQARELGVRTVLGVSNISFGLPCRGYMNTTFLTLAMQAGLDLAIMNPNTPEMMAAVRAYRVLTSQDEKCNDYVAAYANVQVQTSQVAKTDAAAPAGGEALLRIRIVYHTEDDLSTLR